VTAALTPLCACVAESDCPFQHTGEAFQLCRGTSQLDTATREQTRALLTGETLPVSINRRDWHLRTPSGEVVTDRSIEDAAEAAWCEQNRCVHRSIEPIDVVGCQTCGGVENLPSYRCDKLNRQCVDRRPPADPLIVHCANCCFRDTAKRLSHRTDGVTLITPTADRPEMFALCERWMARQTIRDRAVPIQWIVAWNGRHKPLTTMGQELVAVDVKAAGAKITALGASLLAAIPLVRQHNVVIIEDDDWYETDYVERMLHLLRDHDIVGESKTLYYDLGLSGYVRMNNETHASLCQTAIKSTLLPQLAAACRQPRYSVDHVLWRKLPPATRKLIVRPTGRSVGMKGGPGTLNYTLEVTRQRFELTPDPKHWMLWLMIGENDVDAYRQIMEPPTLQNCPEWHQWAASDEGRELLSESRELLVLGKGPTFQHARPWIDEHPQATTIALNHVVREVKVDLAHVIDIEVFDEVPEAAWYYCRRVIVPWRPHRAFRPTGETLATTTHPVLSRLRDQGRLVWYNLSSAAAHGYTIAPADAPQILCQTNSGEAVLRLLSAAGRRHCHTVGIDGGSTYAAAFSDLKPCQNGSTFDRQIEAIRSTGIACSRVS
jgi:hypothetical protein